MFTTCKPTKKYNIKYNFEKTAAIFSVAFLQQSEDMVIFVLLKAGKMEKKFYSFFFLLLLLPGISYSQQAEDFIKETGIDAVIYRGPAALKYPAPFSGSTYIVSDEFTEGEVLYNQKKYYGALLNLDACRDELCVKLPQSGIVIVLSKDLVEEFSLNGRHFIKGEWKGTDLDNTYCQVLYSGNVQVIKKVDKGFYLEEGIRSKVYETVKYYLVKDNVPYRLKRISSIGKLYRKDAGRNIMRALEQMRMSGEDMDEIYLRAGKMIDNL